MSLEKPVECARTLECVLLLDVCTELRISWPGFESQGNDRKKVLREVGKLDL